MLPGYKLFGIFRLYYSFHALAFVALFAFLVWASKKYGIPRWKAAVSTVLIYVMAYAWMLILYWVASGFTRFGGQNIVRIFIWLPVFTFLICKLMKIDALAMCDLVAPCLTLNHGIAHIACIFEGCCYGFESRFGIYNAVFHKYLFPIQLVEAATALVITAVLIVIMVRKKFQTDGKLYPLMLIMFGSTRFLWEFFRDNTKVFWNVSNLAIHALIMTLVGVAWLATANEYEKKRAVRKAHKKRN